MTIVLGFTQQADEYRAGFLVADDLEGDSGVRVDKILKVGRKWAVAVIGLEIVSNAIEHCFTKFNSDDLRQENFNDWNHETFAHEINCAFSFTFRKWNKHPLLYKDGIESKESELVVLDTLNCILYHVPLGPVMSPDHVFEVKFERLEDGQVYEFGATVQDPETSFRSTTIGGNDFNATKKLCFDRISALHEEKPLFFGDQGSVQQVFLPGDRSKDRNTRFFSAFNSFTASINAITDRYDFQAKNANNE